MANIDEQARKIRVEMKKYWGSRKRLAERLKVSEATVRRHLMEESQSSDNIRLETILEASRMLKELKEQQDEKMKQIMSVTESR